MCQITLRAWCYTVFSGDEDAWDGVGLLVLLRMWRVVRIVNGKYDL